MTVMDENESKSMKITNITIIAAILAAALALIVDICDMPSKIGIFLNFDAWNVFVAVAIFVVTYVAINSRDVERKSNQDEVARELLRLTYAEVKSYVDMMGNDDFKTVVRTHIDLNDFLKEQKQYQNLSKVPFAFEDRIFEFAKDGVINARVMRGYISVKQKYERFVTNIILFYDIQSVNDSVREAVKEALKEANEDL